MTIRPVLIAIGLLVIGTTAADAQHSQMPPGMTHDEHLKQMKKDVDLKTRGTAAMGFDQEKTTHHFRLTASGGLIEVGASDPADHSTRAQVRKHLEEIAEEFGRGVFGKPLATHAEMPPGVAVMTRLKDSIAFTSEETPAGGLVRIRTSNAEALRAVHAFLRYQIKEHATGDSLAVTR